jgi:hypothetical protein
MKKDCACNVTGSSPFLSTSCFDKRICNSLFDIFPPPFEFKAFTEIPRCVLPFVLYVWIERERALTCFKGAWKLPPMLDGRNRHDKQFNITKPKKIISHTFGDMIVFNNGKNILSHLQFHHAVLSACHPCVFYVYPAQWY